MHNYTKLIIIVFAVFAITAPHFADARAGGGRSMGSRGTRTYSAPSTYKAQPIQRSTTAAPKPQQQPGMNSAQPGFAPQPTTGAFGGGSPFLRGIAGGFLGAGIASMLFGHAGYAGGMDGGAISGGGSMIGSLLQILMIGGLIYFVIRLFKGSSTSSRAYNMNGFSNNFSANNSYTQVDSDNSTPLLITNSDKEYFEQLLKKIQHNWSEGDLARLRQFVTPEMLQYFSEELSNNASRGLANKVENVVLERADIVESWHEFELDYATATLQWRANDYMVRLDKNPSDSDYIESGSKTETVSAEEVWTFVRSNGGNWLLSAVQQA